jgi:hypothetical protein
MNGVKRLWVSFEQSLNVRMQVLTVRIPMSVNPYEFLFFSLLFFFTHHFRKQVKQFPTTFLIRCLYSQLQKRSRSPMNLHDTLLRQLRWHLTLCYGGLRSRLSIHTSRVWLVTISVYLVLLNQFLSFKAKLTFYFLSNFRRR